MTNTSHQAKLNTYLFSYTHDGAEWAFEVQAEDMEDAKLRVSKMAYAKYDGKLAMKIPVQLGVLPRLLVMLMNSATAIKRGLAR